MPAASTRSSFVAEHRGRSEHAAVGVQPDARALGLGELDHVHHARVQHRLAAAGAAHPGAVLTALVRDPVPQRLRKQIAVPLVVELPDLGVRVGVRTVGAAEVARVDDRDHDHQRKLFRAAAQSV